MRPDGQLGNSDARVLLAVLAGYRRLDDLADVTGMPRSTVYSALKRLRRDEIVTWDEKKRGTLRPLVSLARSDLLAS